MNLNILKNNLYKIIEIDNDLNINFKINNKIRNLGKIENKEYREKVALTTTEIRLLSLGEVNDKSIFDNKENIVNTITDLHTHFTGVLKAKDIYDIAMKIDPKSVLFEIDNLVIGKVLEENTTLDRSIKHSLYELDKLKGFREKIINKMEIKPYKQITFTDMDIIYDLRGPFFASSDPKLFEKYVMKMGESYKEKGVKYVELSIGSKMFRYKNEKEFKDKHKIFNDVISKVKEKYDVELALLLSNSRSKSSEKDIQDFIKTIYDNIKFPYITGIDLLGHEKNSNKIFDYVFASVTRMCGIHNLKHFTIRSHAGETREHESNIKDFLNSVNNELDYMKENENIDKNYYPDIRIGHGVYGVDKEVISLMKGMNVKVEINASSNMALNNIYGLKQIPIRKYIDNGIEVVLGTDGMGIYLNDNKQESIIAHELGVTSKELENIIEFEKGYIKDKNKEKQVKENITLKEEKQYTSKIYEFKGTTILNQNINSIEIETMLSKRRLCFITGMKEKNDKDIEILSKDLKLITYNVKNNNQSILTYDDGSYINTIIEKICNQYNIELIKITSSDIDKENKLMYGNDKYEVSRNLSKYFSKHESDIYVLGGELFASDLLIKLENENVEVIYDPRISGASKEYEERRNNKSNVNEDELVRSGRKK